MMRIVARALFFILQEVDCNHYNLWHAYHAREGLFNAHQRLCSSQAITRFADFRVMCVALDVKDMYSVLPHSEIRNAVSWICTLFQKQQQRDRCSVQRQGKSEGRKERAYDTSQRTEVTLQNIMAMTEMLIQESYFTVGNTMMLQTNGIPMGAPTSQH